MRSCLYLAFVALVACNHAKTQTVDRLSAPLKDGSTVSYALVKPNAEKARAALVLIAGFGQTAESVFPESRIPEMAYSHEILTISVGFGTKMYADTVVVEILNALIKEVMGKYGVSKENFILGGYSIGGAIALRYAEYCKEDPNQFPIVPRAVFAVDSPVDLIDLWYYFEREIARNFDSSGVSEAKYVSAIMRQEIGTPTDNLEAYEHLTPFNRSKHTEGNERYLKDIPIRVYHDLDVSWYLKNRRRSAYDCNFLNTSEMIQRLMGMGDHKAEFIVGKTGYRSNGTRHPHSWSIVDESELVGWISNILQH